MDTFKAMLWSSYANVGPKELMTKLWICIVASPSSPSISCKMNKEKSHHQAATTLIQQFQSIPQSTWVISCEYCLWETWSTTKNLYKAKLKCNLWLQNITSHQFALGIHRLTFTIKHAKIIKVLHCIRANFVKVWPNDTIKQLW